jgi:hypothetical protein
VSHLVRPSRARCACSQGIFCLDLVFSFNTAYLLQEKWIVHRPSIARNYLRGWFWIDAPASLPLVELLSLIKDVDGDEHNQQFLLRAFRLVLAHRPPPIHPH